MYKYHKFLHKILRNNLKSLCASKLQNLLNYFILYGNDKNINTKVEFLQTVKSVNNTFVSDILIVLNNQIAAIHNIILYTIKNFENWNVDYKQ